MVAESEAAGAMTGVGLLGTLPYRLRLPGPARIVNVARSHLRAPLVDDATIREVLDRYGLVANEKGANFAVGRRTDIVAIATSAGPVVVKRVAERFDADALIHEHSVVQRLASVGFPVAPLLVNRQGATVTSVGGRHFSVSELVPGVSLTGCYLPPPVVRRLFHEAGVLLARFHTELQAFRPQGRHHLGLRSPDGPHIRGPEWHLEALERLCRGASHDLTERWLAARSESIGQAIVRLERTLAERALSVGVIHGDYGLHNLTFSRDGTPTLHDLELARLDWLLLDLGKVLSRSKVASGRAFLDGYRSLRDFHADEWASLPEVWQHHRFSGAVRSWHTYRERGGAGRLATARRKVEEAERLPRLWSELRGVQLGAEA